MSDMAQWNDVIGPGPQCPEELSSVCLIDLGLRIDIYYYHVSVIPENP